MTNLATQNLSDSDLSEHDSDFDIDLSEAQFEQYKAQRMEQFKREFTPRDSGRQVGITLCVVRTMFTFSFML